jgi:hypothetical protein
MAADSHTLPHAAAIAAAYEEAAQQVLAAGWQQRQQLRLRLISMVGSCVKAMAGQWQQLSWQWVADQCSLAAQLCFDIWKLEETVDKARKAYMDNASREIKLKWEKKSSQPMPQVLLQAMQHRDGTSLMHGAGPGYMMEAVRTAEELKHPGLAAGALKRVGCVGGGHVLNLAAVLLGLERKANAPDSSSSSSSSSSGLPPGGSSSSNAADTSSSSSSSSSSSKLSGVELEIWLACTAVIARAVRLYGTVLDTALSNPCLFKSSSAEARAAGAEQLARQLAVDKAAGLLLPLPQKAQHEVDKKNNRQYLGSQKGAAAVTGGLLGNIGTCIDTVDFSLDNLKEDVQRLQLPQDTVHELLLQTDRLGIVVSKAAQLWVDLSESSSSGSGDDTDSGSSGPGNRNSARNAVVAGRAAHRRWRWVLNAEDRMVMPLGAAMQCWADAVYAALPSRRCCSNPCCVVVREMSESNLVNGKACCCGGCSAADQAVRYCSRDCQVSHWQLHKALCRSRRRQQQRQQQQ